MSFERSGTVVFLLFIGAATVLGLITASQVPQNSYYFNFQSGTNSVNRLTGNIIIVSPNNNLIITNSSNTITINDIDANGVSAGGINTNVQFNNNGNFGGSNAFTFNSLTNTITATNTIQTKNLFSSGLTLLNGQPNYQGFSGANSPFSIGQSGFFVSVAGVPDFELAQGAYYLFPLWTATESNQSKIYMYNGGVGLGVANNTIRSQVFWHDLGAFNPDPIYGTTYGQGSVLLGDIANAYHSYLFILNQTNGTAYWNGGITALTNVNATNVRVPVGGDYYAQGNIAGTTGSFEIPHIFGTTQNPDMDFVQGIGTVVRTWDHVSGITGELTSNDVAGKTSATPLLCRFTAPNTAMYQISFYASVNSISVDVLQAQTVYTDEQGTARTLTMFPMGTTVAGLSSTGAFGYPTFTIGAKAGTQINTNTILTTSIGSIVWNGGCTISEIS